MIIFWPWLLLKKYFLNNHKRLFSKKFRLLKLVWFIEFVCKKLFKVLSLKSWLLRLLRYRVDSVDESCDDFVGNHNDLFVKSLSKIPDPNNFFTCVIKKEVGIIDSLSKEFLTNQRCCFEIFRFFSILKLKKVRLLWSIEVWWSF